MDFSQDKPERRYNNQRPEKDNHQANTHGSYCTHLYVKK